MVVLSDLFDDVPRLLDGLRQFRFRHHDVVLLHLLDPAEIEFPFDDPRRFVGLESEPATAIDARLLRRAYLQEFERYLQAVKTGARSQGMDYQLLRTDRPFDVALAAYLSSRLKKVKP